MPRISKKNRLLQLAAEHGWARLGEAEWEIAGATIPKLRTEDVVASEIPADAPWCGVRQHTFEELEQCLCAFTGVCETREDLRRFCREIVIRAKDRAKAASRTAHEGDRRAVKAEMAEWMLVWLGDPVVFPAWVAIRKNRMISTIVQQN